jgi:hypothetical protein
VDLGPLTTSRMTSARAGEPRKKALPWAVRYALTPVRHWFVSVVSCALVACQSKPTPVESTDAARTASAVASASAPLPLPPPAAEKKKTKLVLLAGGDVALGRGLGQRILKKPELDPFAGIAPLLKTADVRFVNLECQLSDQGGRTIHPQNHLVFTGPPGGADVLQRAGIDIVSVANNHLWDFGKQAFFETLHNLERVNVKYVGAREEPNQAYQP